MFKTHPIATILNLFALIVAFLFLNNSIFLFFISLALFFSNRHTLRKKYYLLLKITFALAIINLILGHLNFLVKILLVIVYIIEGLRDYSKMDLIYVYDILFPFASNFTLNLLKYTYYPEILRKKYQLLSMIDKELGYRKNIRYYLYSLKKCIMESRKELNKYTISYEKSLYLNQTRNRYKIPFSKEDFFLIMIHIMAVILIIYLGRGTYAIFN